MNKKTLQSIDVAGKLVFLRNDFNVPLNERQEITDDTRIRESLPSLRYLLEKKAKIVCCSHLGRPKGEVIPDCSLLPVAKRLASLLGCEVQFAGAVVGAEVDKAKAALKQGEILLLENLRFQPGETKNDDAFAKELAKGIAVYVNDAFGASHRAHASIAAITQYTPLAVAGFLLEKEIKYLDMATINPPPKYIVILGGAKVSDKIPLITNLLNKAHCIMIGGGMAYTFLKAQGIAIGKSLLEEKFIPLCQELLEKAAAKNVKLLLPCDHVLATAIDANITIRYSHIGETIPADMMGLDIGTATQEAFKKEIAQAELIVWNGPMGVFEVDNFAQGTMEIAHAVAASKATTVIGGGDTVSAVNKAGVAAKISHISTGGGASLEYLSGIKLPGIESLTNT